MTVGPRHSSPKDLAADVPKADRISATPGLCQRGDSIADTPEGGWVQGSASTRLGTLLLRVSA